jgi:hypothetical protein
MTEPYTPNNIYVFTQAFSGCLAGLVSQQVSQPTAAGSYTSNDQIAAAWAIAFDAEWGESTNPDVFESAEIFAYSNDFFLQFVSPGGTAAVTPATYANVATALMTVLTDAETYLASLDLPIIPPPISQTRNIGSMWNEGPSGSQGHSGSPPQIIALVQTTVQRSGVFRISAKANALCVAADVSTWTVKALYGVGAVATTGGASVTTANGIIPTGGLSLISNGASGTGIAITTGQSGSDTLATEATAIGADASLLDKFDYSNTVQNGNTGLPFIVGDNVFLALYYQNSVADRLISSVNLSLEEV